ncbi:unnamed protein product [Paramecium octaurelia]|uniref:Uncharacterized protein n=1 Tax=Paramecium octaurelia TaxID=43137 RepID=A0A8S1XWK2_PAROT|nr:unnamed protein product [Paramecium octaurelia]
MDNQMPIIRKKSNINDKGQEKNSNIPPMINCDKLITNLSKITLMDILDQFAKDSESKSLIEILRSIFEIADKSQRVQEKPQADLWSINNYKDNQKFEFNDEQNKFNRKYGSDNQNTKQKDYRNRDNDKNYQNEKFDRYDRQDKHDRNDRNERNDRRQKYDNHERNDRHDQQNKHEKYQKQDKKDNYDKRDNQDKQFHDNKGRRDYHGNDNQNQTQEIRSDWIVKVPDSIAYGQQQWGVDNFNQSKLQLSTATPK